MERHDIERLVEIEDRCKSNTHRIDEQDKRIDSLERTYSIMEKMDYRMGNVEESVKNINKKLDNSMNEKGKKWDKLIDYLFYFILALLLGYIAVQFGIE